MPPNRDRPDLLLVLRQHVAAVLDPSSPSLEARIWRCFHAGLVLFGVIGIVLATDPAFERNEILLVDMPLVVFTLEYLVRLWIVPELAGGGDPDHPLTRRQWAESWMGTVDLLSVIAIPIAHLGGLHPDQADLLGVMWVFKLGRYSSGLAVLGRVVRLESEPLTGVLFAFLVILLCASVLAYAAEGRAQPEHFGTVPKALWWTIVTLTTTGYGDVTPVTSAGRVLAGVVMMCGIMVFALWAGILATGFAQEMRRLAFLRTWDLVARVPLFHHVGASVIAEVAQRLRPRDAGTGSVIVRKGDRGDCMYFIVSGAVRVLVEPKPFVLENGAFFGEIALITGDRRTATAIAIRPTRLLLLDIADFRDLAARHPELTQAIHEEAKRRMQELQGSPEDPRPPSSQTAQ
jgi:voltage-gated potassium channel